MSALGEHKTVQARILAYAQEIGWIYVPRMGPRGGGGDIGGGFTTKEREG